MPTHEAYSEIPQIVLDKFIEIIKGGKPMPSVEVWVGGEYRFTAIVPSKEGGDSISDDIRTHAVGLAGRSNIPLHPSVYEVLTNTSNQAVLSAVDRMAKAREAKRLKKESALAVV